MEHIFENIRRARKAANKSQKEMAEILKVNRSTYSNWELNTIPNVLTLIKIGEILNVDWTSFVKETIVGDPIKPVTNTITAAIDQLKETTLATKEIAEAILRVVNEINDKKGI